MQNDSINTFCEIKAHTDTRTHAHTLDMRLALALEFASGGLNPGEDNIIVLL